MYQRVWIVGVVALLLTVGSGCQEESRLKVSGAAVSAATLPNQEDMTGGWVGKDAPPFALPGADGKPVDVGKVMGTRPVVLIFYRGGFVPYCQMQMTELAAAKDALLKTGAAVYAISGDAPTAVKKMRGDHKLDFVTFLSDEKGTAGKLYPGQYEGSPLTKPGTFVIDRNKKVIFAHLNEDFTPRKQSEAILEALQ